MYVDFGKKVKRINDLFRETIITTTIFYHSDSKRFQISSQITISNMETILETTQFPIPMETETMISTGIQISTGIIITTITTNKLR